MSNVFVENSILIDIFTFNLETFILENFEMTNNSTLKSIFFEIKPVNELKNLYFYNINI